MSTITSVQGTRTNLTTTALNSLASATYVVAGTLTHNNNKPLDVLLEVTVTPGTVASSKQVVVFAQKSLDGTNFETGPTSGTTTTDEPDLTYIGSIPCNTNATAQTKIFSLVNAYGGVGLPYASKIIIKNETGVALAASGHSVNYAEITGSVV
jgi:hypothetical protein